MNKLSVEASLCRFESINHHVVHESRWRDELAVVDPREQWAGDEGSDRDGGDGDSFRGVFNLDGALGVSVRIRLKLGRGLG